MLSGDSQQVATAVAKSVGIDEAIGDLMPEQKVTAIRKLGDAGGVAMVGDGVNDAPAMEAEAWNLSIFVSPQRWHTLFSPF